MRTEALKLRNVIRAKAWTYWRLLWLMVTRGLEATADELQAVIDGYDRRLKGE